MGYIISLILAIAGWKAMQIIKLPAAALLGPMLFVGIANIAGIGLTPFPPLVTSILQIILGIFVGVKIDREKVEFLKSGMAVPTLMVVFWTILSAIISSAVLIRLTNLDIATILFGATPGGIAEMSIVSMNYGADVAIVSLLQFLRLIMVITIIPMIAVRFRSVAKDEAAAAQDEQQPEQTKDKAKTYIIIGSGLIVGGAFTYFGLPAGGIIGGSIGVGATSIILNSRVNVPVFGVRIAQMGIGLIIGMRFRHDTLTAFGQLMVPSLIFSLLMVISGVLLAFSIKRLTNWDLATCMVCSAPAGISQMILVAADIKADLIKVTYFHLIRLLTIYLIINQIYQWYLN